MASSTDLTSADLEMLDGVLQEVLAGLIRLKVVPLERTAYLKAKYDLAVALRKHANQGERSPDRLRQHAIFKGFQALMKLDDGPPLKRARK
jgi:hypothetical protein